MSTSPNPIQFPESHTRVTESKQWVTPETARRVLDTNTRNRPLREAHVQRLMGEMASGRWQYNGEALKWSTANELLDGQHRLTALSRMPDNFGPLLFLLVRGLPPEAQDTMDQGAIRKAHEQLNIGGIPASQYVTSAVRIYVPWMEGRLFIDVKQQRPSNPEVVEWVKDHPREVAALVILDNGHGLRKVKAARPSLVLAVLLRLRNIDADAQAEFTRLLTTGLNLTAGHPIYALRERLDYINQSKIRTPDREYIAMFVHAWNLWRSGKTINAKNLGAFARNRTAENFPEPK